MTTLTWNDTAVCLGNGQSRSGLDLNKLKDYATVIGCNAIYRDFSPDVLIALDSRMAHEIYRNANLQKSKIYLGYWTPIPILVAKEMIKTMADKIDADWGIGDEVVYHGADGVFTLTKGHNLGITYITGVSKDDKIINIEPDVDGFAYATGSRSVHLACELHAKKVYIVGHDLYSNTKKVNNIYAGTNSYADKDALAARPNNPNETFNWILQHKNTFDKFSNVQFYKVNKSRDGEEAKTASKIPEWSSCENLTYITQDEMEQQLYNE
jgi:hypothetical protein